MSLKVFNSSDIIAFHDELIDNFGGEKGIDYNNIGRIDFIVQNITLELFGRELYEGIFKKAAMLLFFFAKDHCFIDGNKRVAFHSCELFLIMNGYLIDTDTYDMVSYTKGVASLNVNGKDTDEIITSISRHLEKMSYKY